MTIDLFTHNFRSSKPFFLSLGLSLLDGYLGLTIGHFAALRGLGPHHCELGVGVGDLGLGFVLSLDRLGFPLLHVNTLVGLGRLGALSAFGE